jgi:hypothetical protein
MDTLKGLEQSAKQLARRLDAGEGYDATLPIAKKIRTLVRDAQEVGKRFQTLEQTAAKIAPVREALDQLGPYYFDEAPPAGT